MEYDKSDVAFRSKPELGLAMFGGRPINKLTQGHLEIGYGEIFDYFTLYMQAKNKEEWEQRGKETEVSCCG